MSECCHGCKNIIFKPARYVESFNKLETSLQSFHAKVHSDRLSLKQCAEKGTCHLCIVLYGMLVNRERFGPDEIIDDRLVGRFSEISLWLFYQENSEGGEDEEDIDDWEFLEDGSQKEDAPFSVRYHHPLGGDNLCLLNPAVLSRTTWYEEQPSVIESAYEHLQPGLGNSDQDQSTGSDASMAFARGLIEKCRTSHVKCKEISNEYMHIPKRLLEVSRAMSTDEGVIILVDTASLISESPGTAPVQYATLSHRWNASYNYFTTVSNVTDHLSKGMQINLLPKTFAEACVTTRKLGVPYLWIDSLCIIQDSPEDKASEIPNMAYYYQNAQLNISASTQSLGGLWSDRDRKATSPFRISATLDLPGHSKRVLLYVAPELRTVQSHLDYRGWILQERIFPRRTLFFDAYWVSFECSEMSASESCPDGIQLDSSSNRRTVELAVATNLNRDCTLSIIGGLIRSTGPEQSAEMRRQTLILWYRILREYSFRLLSFESDRLDAISGLTARLSVILDDNDYIAGIWRSSIIECLQWRADDPLRGTLAIRQTAYRAPTWSWASCELPPRESFRDPSSGRTLALGTSHAFAESGVASRPVVEVVACEWEPQNAANPFGSLKSAKLTLRGSLLRGFAYTNGRAPDENAYFDTLEEEVGAMPEHALPMTSGGSFTRKELVWLRVSGKTREGDQASLITLVLPDTCDHKVVGYVYLLPLAEQAHQGGGDVLFCLVLKKVGPGTFERVGHSETRSCYLMQVAMRQIDLI